MSSTIGPQFPALRTPRDSSTPLQRDHRDRRRGRAEVRVDGIITQSRIPAIQRCRKVDVITVTGLDIALMDFIKSTGIHYPQYEHDRQRDPLPNTPFLAHPGRHSEHDPTS